MSSRDTLLLIIFKFILSFFGICGTFFHRTHARLTGSRTWCNLGAINFMSNNISQQGITLPIFRIRNISKVYEMGEVSVQALKNVSLDLYPGELLVLLGLLVVENLLY